MAFATIYLDDTEVNALAGGGMTRDASTPENSADAGNSGPEQTYDEDGLWRGYTGSGYFDVDGGAGDKFTFPVVVPAGGADVEVTLRIASGSSADRPIALRVENDDAGAGFAAATTAAQTTKTGGWDSWEARTFSLGTLPEGDYTVTYVQTSGQGSPNVDAVAVHAPGAVLNFLPPAFTSPAELSVLENETAVGAVAATDAEGATVSYALKAEGDHALFTIDPSSGALAFVAAPDFETDPTSYALTVVASDGARSAEQAVTVTVTDDPEQPEPVIEQILLQGEDALIGTGADTFHRNQAGVPADAEGDPNSNTGSGDRPLDGFGLREGYTGTGYTDFGGAGTDETITWDVTVAEAGAYDLTVRYASNPLPNSGQTIVRPLDVAVNGAVQHPEQEFLGTGFQNWVTLTVPVVLEAGPNTLTLAIPAGHGNGPNVDAAALTTRGVAAAFPAAPNAAPAFDAPPASVQVVEGDTAVTTLPLADDGQAPLTFALSGDDAGLFDIGPDGALSFKAAPDFEAPAGDDNDYAVTVTMSDEAGSASHDLTVTVTDDPADNPVPNAAPTAQGGTAGTDEDTAVAVDVADLVADDADADAALTITAEATNGTVGVSGTVLTFTPDPEFAGEATITYRAADTEGAVSADATVAVTVAPVDDAPSAVTLVALDPAPAENVQGAALADIVIADVDSDYGPGEVTLSDPTNFRVVGTPGALLLALADGVALDFEAGAQPSVTVTAGGVTSQAFTPAPLNDPADDGGPVEIDFNAATITGYAGSQDGAGTVTVSPDGASVTLAGNFWKRASLSETYEITGETRLQVTLAQGAVPSEIVAVGFDLDENFSDRDGSIYQLGGTQRFGRFAAVEGVDNGDGSTSFDIDLSAHAGTVIGSLVLIADDDGASNGIGAPTFSNLRLVEGDGTADGNAAPRVVGGGIADLDVNERGTVEIDLAFVDDDGDALSFAYVIEDALGADVTAGFGLTLAEGALGGTLSDGVAPGTYTVRVTATEAATTEALSAVDAFSLTVIDVNDAPVADPGAAFEPLFGAVGRPLDGVPLSQFAGAFSDADGDALTITVEGLPSGLTVEEGAIIGTPTEVGQGFLTVVATDPEGLRAELRVDLVIDAPAPGDVVEIEAEDFTGLGEATNFFANARAGASGDQIIRVRTAQDGEVSTSLAAGGATDGWYVVAIDIYDELDGDATFTVTVGDTVLAQDATFADFGDAPFLNPDQPRGGASQVGNIRRVTFETPVLVDATSQLTIAGQADGELMRIDRVLMTRVEAPNLAPDAPVLTGSAVAENADGAVVGTLAAIDPDGDDALIGFTVDDGRFEVVAGELKLKPGQSLDHEAEPTVTLTVTATDAGGATSSATFAIAVDDVDEAPGPVALAPAAVDENAAGAVIGTLSADDGDGGTVVSFTTTDPRFVVVGGDQLALAAGTSLDHEAGETVTVEVTADGAAAPTTLTVAVNDLDEAPTLAGALAPATIPATGGSVDLSGLAAADEDDGQTPALGVRRADGTAAPAGVLIESGALTVPAGLPAGALALEVFAVSGGLESAPVALTLTIAAPAPFETVLLQGEAFAIVADGDGNAGNDNVFRTETQNQERDPAGVDLPGVPANDGLPDFDPVTGLRPDYTGTGYLDINGSDTGAQASVAFSAPAGEYEVTLRLANGASQARPITVDVDGAQATIANTQTGEWYLWETRTVTLTLPAGGERTLTILQDGTDGAPNIDAVAIHEPGVVPVFVADTTADEGDDLAAAAQAATVAPAALSAVAFDLSGVDADIVLFEASTDGGATFEQVTPAGGTVTLDLSDFASDASVEVTFRVTDAAGNEAETTASVTVGDAPVSLDPIVIQAEDASLVTVDDTGTGPTDTSLTREAGIGLADAFDNQHPGAVGDRYIDFGQDPGDGIEIAVDAPVAGTYAVTFRFAMGANADRPLDLSANDGATQSVSFPPDAAAGWTDWREVTVSLDLVAGANTVRLEIPAGGDNGPNIDQITFTPPQAPDAPSEPGPRDTIRINFQDGAAPKVAGYLVDQFEDFGDRGNGQTYGWVTEASAVDADGTTNTPTGSSYPDIAINERSGGVFDSYDPRPTGYAHFDLGSYPGAQDDPDFRTAWEIALADGFYEVTVSVGDTGGPNDSANRLFVEGQLVTAWEATDAFKSQLVTTVAEVADGHLTLSAQGGTITEMQYLEIRPLPDLTPGDGVGAPADYSRLENLVALPALAAPQPIGVGDGVRPEGIDPTASLAFDVAIAGNRAGVLETSLTDSTVKLFETLTGEEVAVSLNTTGGFEAVVINPDLHLKENTSYTIVVDGLFDRGPNEGDGGPRAFLKTTASFVTGEAPEVVDREVAFTDTVMATEGGFASLAFSPDGSQLYVSTLYGAIIRWDLDPATGEIVASSRETLSLPELGGEAIIGLVFDPTDANRLWITANDGGLSNADDFTGQIWTLDIDPGAASFDATPTLRVDGLPRSARDHLSNSLAFRENPDAGQPDEPSHLLYLIQGSNSAMGAPDSPWGWRAERALAAAVIEIDPDAVTAGGPIDVQTEADWTATPNDTSLDPLNDPANPNTYIDVGDGRLRVDGFYDPFADDAPVRVFAHGQRNAYDLVWHSNGLLYVPTNGSAGGGRAPDDPSTPVDEGITNIPTRNDYLFAVEEGGFYGHPNPILGTFILNGGNPTAGNDPMEVPTYAVGTQPDPNWRGFAFDFGRNVSPNGAAEYTADAFGANLKGAVIVTQYSNPDNLIALMPGADGTIESSQIIRRADGSAITEHSDPLDVIVNPVTGQMYLVTFERNADFGTSSKLVLLNPDPGGATGDTTADAGGDLALAVVDASDPAAVLFKVTGADADIASFVVAAGALTETVAPDADGEFTLDLSSLSGPVTATLTVTDGAGNTASDGVSLTPGGTAAPTDFFDADDFVNLDSGSTLIRVRDGQNPDPGTSPKEGGINAGADGDSYADFGGGAGDKVAVDYVAATAGSYTVTLRMANGSNDQDRPVAVKVGGQSVAISDTKTGGWTSWQEFDVTLDLAAGPNRITVEQLAGNGGPNVDSIAFTLEAAADTTADEGGDLTLAATDLSDPAQAAFTVAGADADLTSLSVAFSDGTNTATATPVGNGAFTADLSGLSGAVTATLTVADGATNTATATLGFTLGADPAVPNDGTETVGGVEFTIHEAENAALTGTTDEVTTAEDDRGQSGGAFVDFDGAGEVSITWTVAVPADGLYQVDFLYALAQGKPARPMELSVDGGAAQTVPFPANSNAGETDWGPSTVSLTLTAGTHTLALSAGGTVSPNLDYLRISSQPLTAPPDLTADEGGDLALAVLDQSDPGAVLFEVSGLDDDIQTVQVAFNGGAPITVAPDASGQFTADAGLTFGQVDAVLTVVDGVGNTADAAAPTFSVAPDGNPNADIAVQSLDPTFFDDRLHFSFVNNSDGRLSKETAQFVITNTGTETLEIDDFTISDFFSVVDPAALAGASIAAGDSLTVTVEFDGSTGGANGFPGRSSNVSGVYEGALTLVTNDAEDPFTTLDLAAFWQPAQEGGNEPNVNEVWQVLGFGNAIAGLPFAGGGENSILDFDDLWLPAPGQAGVEILSPYWRIADGVTEVRATMVAAYNASANAGLGIHAPGSKGQDVVLTTWGPNAQSQTLFPLESGGGFATELFDAGDIPDGWAGNDVFGIEMAGLSTDPTLNPSGNGTPSQNALNANYGQGAYTVSGTGAGAVVTDADNNVVEDGYTVRMFQALDADGNAIENVYLGIMDYTGINYDYNDNMFVFEGITPVGTGGVLAVAGLTGAAADDRLVFSRIDNPANGAQGVRQEATFTVSNDGIGALTLDALAIDGPFQVTAGPSAGAVLQPGQSAEVTVLFTGTDPANDDQAVLHEGTLTLETSAGDRVVALSGLAQIQSEGGEEPTVAQIVEAFGYSTDVAQDQLAGGGVVEIVGDEVLLPYMTALDGSQPVEVIQLAAYLSQGDLGRLSWHGLASDDLTELYAADGDWAQSLLPEAPGGGLAQASFAPSGGFGLKVTVDGKPTFSAWTDPAANLEDAAFDGLSTGGGHYIRFFQALDGGGDVIEGTFIGVQDYPGGHNFDYNDHMFLIRNVAAHALTAAEDANGDGVNDALQDDADGDGVVDFFDDDATPPSAQAPFGGTAPAIAGGTLTVDASDYDEGGQGVAYNDAPGLSGGTDGGRPGSDVEQTPLGDVGWIADGEWLEYTIDAGAGGAFDVSALMAKGSGGGTSFTVAAYRPGEAAPYATTGPIANPSTGGWTTFVAREADAPLSLEAGEQVIRVTFAGGAQDIRSFTLTEAAGINGAPVGEPITGAPAAEEGEAFSFAVAGFFTDPDDDPLSWSLDGAPAGLSITPAGVIEGTPTEDGTFTVTVTASDGALSDAEGFTLTVAPEVGTGPQQPLGGTAPVLGADALTVLAASFDEGGQGVSWNDDPGKDGGNATRPGTDVEFVGGQDDIGFVEAGEWVEYTIDVAEAGSYALSVVAKTPIGGNAVAVTLEDGTELATFALPDSNGGSTGFGGTTFAPTAAQEIALAAGEQTLRFTFEGAPASNGYLLDFRSFTLEQVEGAPDPVGLYGAVEVTQTGPTQWFAHSFAAALDDPIVVMGLIESDDDAPATVRVRDVTSTGFEFQIDEWDYLDGAHGPARLGWMAVEQGVHALGNGFTLEAGSVTGGTSATSVGFGHDFAGAPVVLAQVVTDNGAQAVATRLDDVTADGFTVLLEEEEGADGVHVDEEFHWIAVTPGVEPGMAAGTVGGVNHTSSAVSFGPGFGGGADVFVFAAMNTLNGPDTSTVGLGALTPTGASVFIDEEQSGDAETNHTTETVAWLALDGEGSFLV